MASLPSDRDSHLATALLLVGHGTRSAAGAASFWQVVDIVSRRAPNLRVGGGFLELQQPTISSALEQLYRGGHRRIAVAPLLLFSAGHAKRDIPEVLAEFQALHSDVQLLIGTSWSTTAPLVELAQLKLREATATLIPVETESTLHLMIGRGSLDADATAEMHRLADIVSPVMSAAEHRVAFVAMADPKLETAIAKILTEPWKRIVVQPHLLFAGELLDQISRVVAGARSARPDQQWLMTKILGSELDPSSAAGRLLVDTILFCSLLATDSPLAKSDWATRWNSSSVETPRETEESPLQAEPLEASILSPDAHDRASS